jgi:hypothetical protein
MYEYSNDENGSLYASYASDAFQVQTAIGKSKTRPVGPEPVVVPLSHRQSIVNLQ